MSGEWLKQRLEEGEEFEIYCLAAMGRSMDFKYSGKPLTL